MGDMSAPPPPHEHPRPLAKEISEYKTFAYSNATLHGVELSAVHPAAEWWLYSLVVLGGW